jgi:DNA-binding PadR family transcriptional regulator
MTIRRMTMPTAMVLEALAAGHRYGFEIADAIGLRPGSVYQVLRRLEEAGIVRAFWEESQRAHDEGRPPRRYYELVGSAARAVLSDVRRRYPAIAGAVRQASGAAGAEGTA